MLNLKLSFVSFAIVLSSCFHNSSFSQAKWHPLPKKPGKWTYSYHNEPYGPYAEKNYKLETAELSGIKQKLATLAEVLHQNPEVTGPVGYDVVATGSFYCYDETAPRANFPQAEINLKFYSLWGDNTGNVKRYWGEVPEIECLLNDATPGGSTFLNYRETGYDYDTAFNNACKKLNQLFIRPAIVKEIAPGITAYNDGTIVIAKPGKPYWIPVTFGEWFDLMENYEKQSNIKNKIAPEYLEQTPYAFLKKDKSIFPASWLSAPSKSIEELIKEYPDEEIPKLSGVFPIFASHMRLNPDYFDKSLPKSAIQIIILRANTSVFQDDSDCSGDDVAYTACCKFAGSVDFEALRKLLNP
jgi:hypothetical protein